MAPPATISALIVTRDRPALLADALASVAAQSRVPLETRVADDGEAPLDPGRIGEGLLEIHLIRSVARSAAGARNLAAREARGDVLAFLDDDDLWLPGHLEGLASAFEDQAVSLAYRDSVIIRESLDPGGRTEIERRVIAHDWDDGLMR